MVRRIYFDYNATTPLDAAVREAMLPCLHEIHGNPSSIHYEGRRARALLDGARERVAGVWRCKPNEVVFTSGGTESNNLALLGSARLFRDRGRHIITSRIEHHSVIHSLEYLARKENFEVTYLPVTPDGFVEVDSLAAVLRPDTVLVSVMAANNETGAIQPVAALGALCRERGVLFHTDAVHWFGKEPFDNIEQFNADMVSVCAHKFHGPKGAGALFIRSPLHPEPILLGGSHESERRAGTENLAAIVGFAEATDRFVRQPVFASSLLQPLTDALVESISQLEHAGCTLRSPAHDRLANTIAFTVTGSDSITLLANLDLEGISASGGAACSAGSLEPSHVMLAIGLPPSEANSLVRFSLGRASSPEDIVFVKTILPSLIARSRTVE
jgi:cysteine desulfurase